MAALFSDEDEFDDASAHIKAAKSHSVDGTYELGRGLGLQAVIWYRQSRLELAKSEGPRALGIFERLKAVKDTEGCRHLLRRIKKAIGSRISGELSSG